MDDTTRYCIIANCEDEYALWPVQARVPAAWRHIGIAGSREQCLEYIQQIDTANSATVRRVVERQSRLP